MTLLMEVSANRAVEHLELVLDADEGLVAEAPNPILIHLSPGERRELEVPIRCAHWGTYEVGSVVWRARDPFGLFVYEGTIASGHRLKVYPRGETLQRLLRPLETQAFSGNQVARSRGEGIEFADLRPFTYGDQVRRVNWRATARRGEPWVNETHPERNSDIVIFLDTFAEARRPDLGTLDIGVRAAASLAALYLREKDRVGLVCVRRGPQLADGDLRDDAALPDRRLAARRRDPAQLRVEGPRRDPAADAAAARARVRVQPAAGRAGGRRSARPACARLRPRRDRALAATRSCPRARPSSSSSPTGSGGFSAMRCARSTRRWACRSSSGGRVSRWKRSWRRCGHSGATPESFAPSDRRASPCSRRLRPRGVPGFAEPGPAVGGARLRDRRPCSCSRWGSSFAHRAARVSDWPCSAPTTRSCSSPRAARSTGSRLPTRRASCWSRRSASGRSSPRFRRGARRRSPSGGWLGSPGPASVRPLLAALALVAASAASGTRRTGAREPGGRGGDGVARPDHRPGRPLGR